MAKGMYLGVAGTARKVKKSYIGVNGIARKIKKIYVGVNNIARLCWSGGLSKATSPQPLSVAKADVMGGSIGDYAIFVGGSVLTGGNSYNKSLVRGTVTDLTSKTPWGRANVGNYLLFAIGSNVQRYDTNLTASTLPALPFSSGTSWNKGKSTVGARAGSYAVFYRGFWKYESWPDSDDADEMFWLNAYNASLVRTDIDTGTYNYNNADSHSTGASNGIHAVYPARYVTSSRYVNSSLVRGSLAALTDSRFKHGASFANKAIFFGAEYDYSSRAKITAEYYNTSLVKTTISSFLSQKRSITVICYDDEHLIITGSSNSVSDVEINKTVDSYDVNLVRTPLPNMTVDKSGSGAIGAAVGNYYIFAGGASYTGGASTSVEVYEK